MNRTAWTLLLGLGLLAAGTSSARAEGKKDEKKGAPVEIDGLRSQAPATWKEESPNNRMRVYQFRIPKSKGDKDDAELAVFYFEGAGGSAADNVKRWKDAMVAPEGKKIDDVARVEKLKVGDVEVTYLDVRGTYKYKARPNDPNAKVELRPDYRLLGVVFESPKGPYFFRLVGPAGTIAANKAGFEGWVKGFK